MPDGHYLFIYIYNKINIHFLLFSPFYYSLPPLPLLFSLSHLLSAPLHTVEPKVYVSAGPAALLDGGNESLVATCIAERGRPAAKVFWETEVHGRREEHSQDEPNGTTTVQVRYMWQPQSDAQGKKLNCVVQHPALQTEFRIPYTLNVHCEC